MIGTVLRARICRQTSKPSTFGQHHVEHDEVEAARRGAGRAPRGRRAAADHVVALLAQRIGEQLLNRLLVVDEQDAWCRARHLRDCRLRRGRGWTGELRRVIEPRVYRAAFVPALLAVVLAMFSLEERPPAAAAGAGGGRAVRRRAGRARARRASREPHPTAGRARRRPRHGGARRRPRSPSRGFRVERDRFTHAGPRPRERDRPPARAGPGARSWWWPRATRRGSRRRRQRGRHRGAARAGARVRGAARRARRSCWRRVDGSTLGEVGARGWPTSSAIPTSWTACS